MGIMKWHYPAPSLFGLRVLFSTLGGLHHLQECLERHLASLGWGRAHAVCRGAGSWQGQGRPGGKFIQPSNARYWSFPNFTSKTMVDDQWNKPELSHIVKRWRISSWSQSLFKMQRRYSLLNRIFWWTLVSIRSRGDYLLIMLSITRLCLIQRLAECLSGNNSSLVDWMNDQVISGAWTFSLAPLAHLFYNTHYSPELNLAPPTKLWTLWETSLAQCLVCGCRQ
jgi:hypothetical protein